MLKPLFHYGGTFLLSAIQAIQQQGGTFKGPHDKLKQYLEAGVEATNNIIGWWGVSPIYLVVHT